MMPNVFVYIIKVNEMWEKKKKNAIFSCCKTKKIYDGGG